MSRLKRFERLLFVLTFILLFSRVAQATVSLAGTRLIFDGAFREVSIEAINHGSREILLQAWLGDATDADATLSGDLPFAVIPHLSQLPANGKQVLRILYEGVGLPQGQESLLHLYVMEIPRRAEGENQLSIAIRQRINVFYRPPGLAGDPADTAQALRWNLTRDASGMTSLQVSNLTAYHASLQNLQLESTNAKREVSDYLLLPPGVTRTVSFTVAEPDDTRWHRLSFKALTDYGGQRAYSAEIDWRLPFNARLLPDTVHLKDAQP